MHIAADWPNRSTTATARLPSGRSAPPAHPTAHGRRRNQAIPNLHVTTTATRQAAFCSSIHHIPTELNTFRR